MNYMESAFLQLYSRMQKRLAHSPSVLKTLKAEIKVTLQSLEDEQQAFEERQEQEHNYWQDTCGSIGKSC